MTKAPNSRRNLDEAIRRASGAGNSFISVRTAMANTIVAQMLPNGVVKGGSALKLRFGNSSTRLTTDLDAACSETLDVFIDEFEKRLVEGWFGFTGYVVSRPPAKPDGVPSRYVMQPFDIKLSYNGKSWLTVPLEIGHNEIGDASEVEYGIASDIIILFEAIGLPAPGPAPLMPLSHQVAQKLHGLSEPGSRRAHDLIDLQIIMTFGDIDRAKVKSTCERLFLYRRLQEWPPVIVKGGGWDDLYAAQANELDVFLTVDEAIGWANGLVEEISNYSHINKLIDD